MSEFYVIFARKKYQNSRFFSTFCPKMSEFYMIIARKICSRFWGVTSPSLPPTPTPMVLAMLTDSDRWKAISVHTPCWYQSTQTPAPASRWHGDI